MGSFGLCLFSWRCVAWPQYRVTIQNSVRWRASSWCDIRLGSCLGIFFYAFLVAFGLSVTLSFIPFLIDFLNVAGLVFLLWLAYVMLSSSFARSESDQQKFQISNTLFGNFGSGFLIVFLNPKIALFFLAIFTQFADDASSFQEKAIMISTATIVDTSWYIFLTFILALPKFRNFLQSRARRFEFALGCFFIVLCLLLGHKILVDILI